MLAKQLWQPVSAMAESCTGVSRDVGGCNPVLCSLQGGLQLPVSVRNGWGLDDCRTWQPLRWLYLSGGLGVL